MTDLAKPCRSYVWKAMKVTELRGGTTFLLDDPTDAANAERPIKTLAYMLCATQGVREEHTYRCLDMSTMEQHFKNVHVPADAYVWVAKDLK